MRHVLILAVLAVLAGWSILGADPADATTLRFEVTVARGLLPGPRDGRILVVLGQRSRPEPRHSIGEVSLKAAPLLGKDASALAPGVVVSLDRSSMIFPISHLAKLPRGDYHVQAVFAHDRDLNLPDAPGNLVSEPRLVTLDPAVGGVVRLELTRKLPDEVLPADTEQVKFVKIRSESLSKYHGRPMYLRAGVILPRGYATETERTYPLLVAIGGYGSRYTTVQGMMHEGSAFRQAWQAADAPRMVLLHLDGAGPLGDPYQVNSANHGPYGDAVTGELIPHVEKRYRGMGKGSARVLEGASTGGWVSLALQIFYPDFFNGTWSHCPDPVDFRAFELIDLYRDGNAYVNPTGFERPAMRTTLGDTVYTVRLEVQLERVLGRGDRWTLSGKDWGAWNATFGPRGKDGLPVPLWDGKTGQIDRAVVEHWKKYDLRLHLETHWAALGPRLAGKLRIWVGDADEYFLDNAVRLLDGFLKKASRPAFDGKITFAPRQGHFWRGVTEKQKLAQMGAVVEKATKR